LCALAGSAAAEREAAQQIREGIQRQVQGEEASQLLVAMLDGVEATVRTNFFVPDRYGFGIRLLPTFMGCSVISETVPYGTFFVRGRRCVAFHVRFRDVARGGLRMSVPTSPEDHASRRSSAYEEAYSLAYAQQLKNKDIPEGGSKAVCVVDTTQEGVDPDFLTRKSFKSFADTILTLTSQDEKINACIVNRGEGDGVEQVYLGPDENIIPYDIEWATERAAVRGCGFNRAFMSSKPDAGFNHKEYGVTSEGVNVFLGVALKEAGFEPETQPFTVKITGGTDGDVAGNMILCLARDYPHAKIVGICDASATLEDPDGLDLETLCDMVRSNKPLAAFDREKLGARGDHWGVDTEEGLERRNTMPLRVQADVFVPGGGRPASINEGNWRQFLRPDGQGASSQLVVEGANLFLTPQARQHLFEEAGAVVIKDSSANKCGVITSSYEILLSMMFEKDEFIRLKPQLVEDVVERFKHMARAEAQLLFSEKAQRPGMSLPDISTELSNAITRTHDALEAKLRAMTEKELAAQDHFRDVLLDHLPSSAHAHQERLFTHVPLNYRLAAVAANLASNIVYSEGTSFITQVPDDQVLASLALRYRSQKQRVTALTKTLRERGEQGLTLAEAEEVVVLLERGGVRAGLQLES
jgi:glutamate dehydrogenase